MAERSATLLRIILRAAVAAVAAFVVASTVARTARAADPAVALGPGGKLAYAPTARGDVVPDFSNCGFGGGGVALPTPADVPIRATVRPGKPGGADDDTPRIQAAIDEVAKVSADARGIRGAVLLARGAYRINTSIAIRAGGVVLRGEGQGETDGTILVATGTARRAIVNVGGGKNDQPPSDDADEKPAKGEPKGGAGKALYKVVDRYAPVGTRTLTLDRADGLKVGDHVIVRRPSTAEWIAALGMDHIPPRKDGGKVVQWTPGSKDLNFDRIITSVDGPRVTLDAPITCALDEKFGGGTLRPFDGPPRLRMVGVENLRGVSEFKGDTDEEHSWTFIQLAGVENAWVRDVTSAHFAFSLVTLGRDAKWCTVQDCTCLDPISQITGGRRYSFCMTGGQLCLVQRCAARNGRHDFVMGSTVPGPNAFLNCHAEQTHADAGPHHRWSTGVLYDNLRLPDGELNVRDRGNMGSGHGWAGANQVAWNCEVKSMFVQNPPTAQNWAIGCTTTAHKGDGIWESIGRPVQPQSLYLAQLRERLGDKAVANVAR